MKLHHDRKIEKRIFEKSDQVLLYNSWLHLFSGKVKSRWYGLLTMLRLFPYGAFKLKQDGESLFKVNGQRVKHYMGNTKDLSVIYEMDLGEV